MQNGGSVPCSVAEQIWRSPNGFDTSYNYNDFLHYACKGTSYPTECSITGVSTIYPLYGNMPRVKVDLRKTYYYLSDGEYVFQGYQDGEMVIDSYSKCPENHLDETIPAGGSSNWRRLCKPINYNAGLKVDKIIPFESKEVKNSCSEKNGTSYVGDPIDIASGNKTLSEIDYDYKSVQEFMIKRNYSSLLGVWRFDFQRGATYSNINGEILILERQSGQKIALKKENNNWVEVNSNYGFNVIENTSNGLKIFTPSFEIESYEIFSDDGVNKSYRLSLIENEKKQKWFYEYSGMSLTKISNSYGMYMNLEYSNDCKKTPKSITINGSKRFQYEYSGYCNLEKVIYPDMNFKKYLYESITNNYFALTKVIDESGKISQLTSYLGVRASSESIDSTNTVEKISLDNNVLNTIKIKDGNNNISTLNTESVNGLTRITGYDSFCAVCNGLQGSLLSYNSLGYVSNIKDYKNNNTSIDYNSRGNVTQTKAALGTNIEEQKTYVYDISGERVISKIESVSGGSKITSYQYDNNKNIIKINIDAPKNDGSGLNKIKEVNFVYNVDKLIEVRGVNYQIDSNDKKLITYNGNGQIYTLTNELGQTTTYSSYDDYGNPTQIINPDSTIVNLTYDLRGRLTSISLTSSAVSSSVETTSFEYSSSGLLTKMIYPSSNFKKLFYDEANRLIKIEEYEKISVANPNGIYLGKLEYTLDNMSNPTQIKVFNAQNIEERISTLQYDDKNRLYKTVGTLNQTTSYKYDENSNLKTVIDAENNNFSNNYDELNRVVEMIYPDNSKIQVSYNNKNVASITDQKGLVTSYVYDGFDNLIKMQSPDTGITTLNYDNKNNLILKKDNKNQEIQYTYDLLGRLKSIVSVGGASPVVSLTYDTCKVGKLCSITDGSGVTNYSYNDKSRLVSKSFIPSGLGVVFESSYQYDDFGNILSFTYPSLNTGNFNYIGSTISYSYENDKIKNILKSGFGSILTNIEYDGFSYVPKNFNIGAYIFSRKSNKDGLLESIRNSQVNSYNKDYTYNSVFNIEAIKDKNNPIDDNISISYDSRGRVIETNKIENGHSSIIKYGYNTSDDRISVEKNSVLNNYSYPIDNHRLSNVGGTNNFMYDDNGNIVTVSDLGQSMTYDNFNRLLTSNSNLGNATYVYNALNQRVKKSVIKNGIEEVTWFFYDEEGKLIADYVNKNNTWVVSEYVYLYDKPVAMIRDNQIYHIQTDHLNTPRTITRGSDGTLVWSWDNKEVFGDNLPSENISGTVFNFNLRFAGQYWDDEKNTSYNYHRDYSPNLGRYIQSDPIGLNGGINTYGYVNGNSVNYTDSFGLVTSLIYVEDSRYRKANHVAMYINGLIYQSMPISGGSSEEMGIINMNKNLGFSVPSKTIQSPKEFLERYLKMDSENLLLKDKVITIHSVVLNLSPEIERDLISYYSKNENYDTWRNNCAQVINRGLENSKLKQSNYVLLPSMFFNSLNKDAIFKGLIKKHHHKKNVFNITIEGDLE